MPLAIGEMVKMIVKMNPKRPFVVFKRQINTDNINLKSLAASMATGNYIFQTAHVQDMKRKQKSFIDFRPSQMKPIEPITTLLRTLFELVGDGKGDLSPVSVLQSLPGCVEQRAHCDFNLKESPLETIKSYLSLIALQDNTKFVIYTDQGREEIILNKGDILIGRGDLIHAGGSFDEMNLRVHYYWDYPGNRREMTDTYFFDPSTLVIDRGDYYAKFHEAVTNNLQGCYKARDRARKETKRRSDCMIELNSKRYRKS